MSHCRQCCGCARLQFLIPKAPLPQPLPSVTYVPALHTAGMRHGSGCAHLYPCPTKLIPKLTFPNRFTEACWAFWHIFLPATPAQVFMGVLHQVLHMPALEGLGVFSNRQLDLLQIYHYILLMVLPIIKLFWNTVALFFSFAPELDLPCAQVTKGKEKNNHSSCQSDVGSVLPITRAMVTPAHIIQWA